jgi:hypothetical protein
MLFTGEWRMSKKESHLEMVQGIIGRMSQNSFLLKGWSVVLVSALFALSAKDQKVNFIFLAYFPCIAFWTLDSYYLWQERKFRALYDQVRLKPEDHIDYSMNVDEAYTKHIAFSDTLFSKTVLAFHAVILASIIVAMIITI